MNSSAVVPPKPKGLRRHMRAFANSWAGLRNAFRTEAAVRQEVLGLIVLIPLSLMLPVSTLEHLLLVVFMLQVLLMELVNTAIEATVDRISLELHPLAGHAKDLGSAAVLVSLIMAVLCWIVIGTPVFLQWWRR